MKLNRLVVALMSSALVLAGCGGSDESSVPVSPTTAPPSAEPTRMGKPSVLVTDLQNPWGIAFLPSGDALVGERPGRLNILNAADPTKRTTLDVPGVVAQGEGGLLGIAVSPSYASDKWIYAYTTTASDNRVIRFHLNADNSGVSDTQVVTAGIAKASNHNGGRIAFGPDEMLYVATGDANQPSLAQDATSLNGKILRMSPDGTPAPGNPTPTSLVYSLGHRNVQGLAWGPGERLYATEFGQNTTDEVNIIEGGANYGWPEVEGGGDPEGGKYRNPIATWSTDEASPSGVAFVQEGPDSALYVAALRGERLWRIGLNERGEASEPEALLQGDFGRLRTPVVAPDGSLWVGTSNSNGDRSDEIIRLTPQPK